MNGVTKLQVNVKDINDQMSRISFGLKIQLGSDSAMSTIGVVVKTTVSMGCRAAVHSKKQKVDPT